MAPCKRPPSKKATTAAEQSAARRVPSAPLADYAGEVMTVKGRKNHVDVEYLIYNARVPSIRAVNMQLMADKRRRCAEAEVSRLAPDTGIVQHHECDHVARRRLLEHLQKSNREQAQRRREERERERQHQLEREAIELRAAADGVARERAAVAAKKHAEREFFQRAALEAIERKRQEAADTRSRNAAVDDIAFFWSDARRGAANKRAECLALMEANRELAEQAKTERREREMREKARERAALAEAKAKLEKENRRAQEEGQRSREGLKREMDAAREARVQAREREVAWERRCLEMCTTEARRSAERERERDVQKRANYRKALEEQLESRKGRENHRGPTPHRGPEKRVLYRCPVTGELLPPDQFGLPSTYLHDSKWIV